jgi:MFS family permease
VNPDAREGGFGPLLLASATLTVMAGAVIGPVVARIGRALDLTPTEAGLVITTHGLAIALVSLGAGRLIDRVGPRTPLAVGLLLYGVAGGAGLLIRNFLLLLLSRVLVGVGVAGIFTGVTVTILRAYAGVARQRMMGYRGAAQSIGGAVWPLVGGAAGSIAWFLPFGIYLLGIPLGIMVFLLVPEMPVAPGEKGEKRTSVSGHFDPKLLLPYFSMFVTNLLLYGIVVFFPQRLDQLGIRNTVTVSLFLAAAGVFASLTAAMYARISTALTVAVRASASLVIWIPAFALAALADSWPLLLASAILFGIGQGVMLPTVVLWVDTLASRKFQATASSLLPVTGFAGQFLSPLILGPVTGIWGFRAMFFSVSALPLALLVTLMVHHAAARPGSGKAPFGE